MSKMTYCRVLQIYYKNKMQPYNSVKITDNIFFNISPPFRNRQYFSKIFVLIKIFSVFFCKILHFDKKAFIFVP
jgi:hypothetical protein